MKDVIMSFKTTEEMKQKLKDYAKIKDMSVSAIIRKALEAYFEEGVK